MNEYTFTIKLVGYGASPQEAWQDLEENCDLFDAFDSMPEFELTEKDIGSNV